MNSDWHPGLVSKKYKENWEEIIWDHPSHRKATIEGTSSRYRWKRIMDNRDIRGATVILEEEDRG